MPRSLYSSKRSRYCSLMARESTVPVFSSRRSASVDLPWSTWAMMQKFRIRDISKKFTPNTRIDTVPRSLWPWQGAPRSEERALPRKARPPSIKRRPHPSYYTRKEENGNFVPSMDMGPAEDSGLRGHGIIKTWGSHVPGQRVPCIMGRVFPQEFRDVRTLVPFLRRAMGRPLSFRIER